jgi:hypothetical protein
MALASIRYQVVCYDPPSGIISPTAFLDQQKHAYDETLLYLVLHLTHLWLSLTLPLHLTCSSSPDNRQHGNPIATRLVISINTEHEAEKSLAS